MGRRLCVLLLALAACRGLGQGADSHGPLPDVARVVCDEEGTRVLTPEVRPQPDGVHVVLDNRTGQDLALSFDSGYWDGGDNANMGSTEYVWLAPPGPVDLACFGKREEPNLQAGASFQVIDPDGLWVSPSLECEPGAHVVSTEGGSYASPPPGDPRDPVEIAKEERFAPFGPGEVEAAGYPEAEHRLVRLIRDGRTVAVAEYVDASFAGGEPGSGWVESGYEACDERGGLVARTQAVAAVGSPLGLDGDPQLGELDRVAANGARVDLQALGELRPAHAPAGLEDLEHGQEPRRRTARP